MRILALSVVLAIEILLSGCGAAPQFDGSVVNTGGGGNGPASKTASSIKSGVSSSPKVTSTPKVSSANTSVSNPVSTSSSSLSDTSNSSSSSLAASSVEIMSSSSKSSSAPKTKSHNVGKNCLSCHKKGGPGEAFAVFTAAGSIYQSNGAAQTNAIIRLYVPGTNTIDASLETDLSGNFYTSDVIPSIASGAGVDAEVEGPGGQKINMGDVVKNGGCSSCHNGAITNKITID
jgi:hypothetical protein